MAETKTSAPATAESTRECDNIIVPDDDESAVPDFLDTASEAGSSTTSLSSSVLNYQYENGRRYHAYREGAYFAPNDEREQERMDLLQHITRMAMGGELFLAPIGPSPKRILDLGTGTGTWANAVADLYPKAAVIGTDLSPIQSSWVAPNCYFEVDDFEAKWQFSRPFDLIHAGSLAGSVEDFPRLLQQAKKNLKTGGWMEFTDFAPEPFSDDNTLERAPYFREWSRLCDEASIKFGKRMNITSFYKQWMIDAGFKNVTEHVHKVPMGPWAKDTKLKELGAYMQYQMLESLEAYSLALMTRVLGWSVEEVHVFLAGLRAEIYNRKLHLYSKLYFVYGQKQDEEDKAKDEEKNAEDLKEEDKEAKEEKA